MLRVSGVLGVLCAALALACGGGGDSAVSGGGGSSNLAGSFDPDAENPGSNTVYTTGTPGSGANASLVTIHVIVSGTSDVFGASFDLSYDPTKAQFANWSPGDLLEFGSQSVSYQVNATTPGRLVVGVARTSGGVGVTVTGVKTLVNLTFRVLQTGSAPVGFENPALLNSQNPPAPKTGIAFFGGMLTAV